MENIFFDTEFSRLHKDGFLISLGCVDQNGNEFYWEAINYKESECSQFVIEKVIPKLKYLGLVKEGKTMVFEDVIDGKSITHIVGTKYFVKEYLIKWLSRYDSVQFISDVCHYDFTFLIDIFGGANDLPKNVAPVCYDINQDIATHFGISDKQAFDKNREDILRSYKTVKNGTEEIYPSNSLDMVEKHNSLYDAYVIKDLYKIVAPVIGKREKY